MKGYPGIFFKEIIIDGTKIFLKSFTCSTIFIFGFLFFLNCTNDKNPFNHHEFISIEKDFNPSAQTQLWKNGKKAAYTLAFDDARCSHYQLAWPEMEKKGITGTFFINTDPNLNWIPWIYLAKFGNEIASHTVNHVDLTSLSSEAVEYELKESFEAIWKNAGQIPESFANPFGRTNQFIEEKIKLYYLSARNQYGINSSVLDENDFYYLRAIGAYPSVSQIFLRKKLVEVINKNGYLIVSFHSLTEENAYLNETYLPIKYFQNHLDDVCELSNDLWIAPQKDVVKYIRVRQSSELQVDVSFDQIKCYLKSNLDKKIFNSAITVQIKPPQNWKNKEVLKYAKKSIPFSVFSNVDSVLCFDMFINEEILLKAF